MGAVRSAMFAFSGVEASCEQPLSQALLRTPRRLFLALGYAFGIVECGDILHAKYPMTFRLTQILIAHSWAKDTIEEECPFPVPPGFLDKDPLESMLGFREVILQEGLECPFKLKDLLFASIRAGRADLVQKCLDNGASPNEPLEEDDRATPLHASCLIPDAEGAEIAKILLSAGADMSIRADEEVEVYSNPFYCGRYTPIHWAISKNRVQVFSALLDWCSESSVEPMDGGLSLVDHMVYHRRLVLLRRYMDFLRDHGRENSMSPRKMCHLLRASVEETDDTTCSQRWMHAENFRSCRRGMILYLLELGADPLVLEGDLNPIRFSIKEGDNTWLRPILNSVEAQGHDLKHILSRDGLCRNGLTKTICWSALLTSTLSSCMDVFYYLSDHHPELINQRSVLGITPLFQVASEGKMGAVKALLERGADPNLTLPNEPHSTPLTMALVNGYYDVARAIFRDSVHSELLFPLPNWSVFGAVLGTFCSGRRHIELQAFSFIHENGGLTYMIRGQYNVFREILHRERPFLEEDVGRELDLLRFLLRKDTFGDKINEHDWTGRAPIHYAARYGYLEAVELLLDHGADVNLGCAKFSKLLDESDPDSFDENVILGQTAIDAALTARRSRTRDIILAGGAAEVRAWQIRIKQAVDLIVQRGGHVGDAGSAGNYMELEKLKDPRRWKRFHQSYIDQPEHGDETWRGAWPGRIPVCPTATEDPNSDIPVWFKEQKDISDKSELERLKHQTILYRTSNGRRHRITPFYLEI